MTVDPSGMRIHPLLGDEWRIVPEDPAFRERVLETVVEPDGSVRCEWVPRRQLPHPDSWFETAWARFRDCDIYDESPI